MGEISSTREKRNQPVLFIKALAMLNNQMLQGGSFFSAKFRASLGKKFLLWIALGLAIRFFLMAFTVHPDFFFINMFPNLLLTHQTTNIYGLLEKELASSSGFYYNPFVLYFFSAVQLILTPITPSFHSLMDQAYLILKLGQNTSPIIYFSRLDLSFYWNFFVMKLPYLFFDFGVLFILFRLQNNWKIARRTFYLWIFNPMVLYGVYIFGQFDIIPAFLLIYGIYLATRRKLILGMLVVGLSATFKNFALLAVLPIALTLGKNYREKLLLSILGFLPFVISYMIVFVQAPNQAIYTLIPRFYISKAIQNPSAYAFISKILRYTTLAISYLTVLILANYLRVEKSSKIVALTLISLLLLFALSPIVLFHYFIIALPLLILYLSQNKWFTLLFLLFIASIAIFKNWTRIQQFGLLAPIDTRFYTQIPSSSEMINRIFPYAYLSSFFYVVFFGLSIFFITSTLKKLIFQSK